MADDPRDPFRPITSAERDEFLDYYVNKMKERPQVQAPSAPSTLDDILGYARWGLAGASLLPPANPILAALKGIGALGSTALGAYDTYEAASEGDIPGALMSGGFTAIGASGLRGLAKNKAAQAAATAAAGTPQTMMQRINAQFAAQRAAQTQQNAQQAASSQAAAAAAAARPPVGPTFNANINTPPVNGPAAQQAVQMAQQRAAAQAAVPQATRPIGSQFSTTVPTPRATGVPFPPRPPGGPAPGSWPSAPPPPPAGPAAPVRPGGYPQVPPSGAAASTTAGPGVASVLANAIGRGTGTLPGVAASNLPAVRQLIEAAAAGATPVRQAAQRVTNPKARKALIDAAEEVTGGGPKASAFLKKLPVPAFKFGGRELAVEFENPVERAAYQIAGGMKRTEADDKLLKYVMTRTGVDEHTARAYGTQIRNRMKELAATLPGDAKKLLVPTGGREPLEKAVAHLIEREKMTGMTAAQRAAHAQGEKAQRLAREAAEKSELGDLSQMPELLKSFRGLLGQVTKLTKAGQPVPETMRTALAESLQVLNIVQSKAPDTPGLAKILAGGAAALVRANTAMPLATAALRKGVKNVTKARAKDVAAKLAGGETGAAAEDTLTALSTKLGNGGEVTDKLVKAIRGAAKNAKTPEQRKVLKDLAGSAAKLLMDLHKNTEGGMGLKEAGVMAAIAGGAVGGMKAGEAMQPDDDPRNPETWKWAGGAAGTLMAIAGSKLALSPTKLAAAEKLINWNRFSLLSGPGPIGRANLGSTSSVFLLAAERMAEGKFADAAKGLSYLASQTAKGRWFRAAFGDPASQLDSPIARASFQSRAPFGKGVTNWPGRAIAAGDVVSTNAIMKMGYSFDEAQRANLSSDSATNLGQAFMRLTGEATKKKVTNPLTGAVTEVVTPPGWDKKEHPGAALLAGWMAPFARTAVNTVEQGFRYSPFGALPWAQHAFGQTRNEGIRKALIGSVGGVYGGKKVAENTSAEFDPLTIAAGGPMALPIFVGQRIARGAERDVPWQTVVQQAVEEIPLMGEQFGVQDIVGRTVPSGLRDIARAIDPAWEREKGAATVRDYRRSKGGPVDRPAESLQTAMAGVVHRLPILRESLPERFVGVNAYGEPHYRQDRPSFAPAYIPDTTLRGDVGGAPVLVLPKILTTTPIQNPARLPKNDPMAQRFKALEDQVPEMGATITAPSMPQFPELENEMRMTGMPVQPIGRDLRAASLRAKGVTNQRVLEQLDQMPGFWQLPPQQQHLMARTLLADASKEGSDLVTPAMQGATMMPGMRGEITQQLRDYIQMMEQLGQR